MVLSVGAAVRDAAATLVCAVVNDATEARADAEILLRYEAAALTTLAATPLWDRDAYDGRQLLAKSFGDERTRLHDETRSRLELISGKQ